MKIEHTPQMPASASVGDVIELARTTYQPEEPSSAWEMRHALLALAQNREVIWQLILESLMRRLATPLPSEQASYYVLFDCPDYSLRATVWMPENGSSEVAVLENGVYAYDYPHNHNFDLLTVNVFGPGYETDLYSIEILDSDTCIGEVVAAEELGRFRLRPGAMLFYEAFTDVHVQIPVEEISVALNFMPRASYYRTRPQHAFEVAGNNGLRVSGSPLCEEARELWAMRLLGKLVHTGVDVTGMLDNVRTKASHCAVGRFAGEIISLVDDPDRFQEMLVREQSGAATVNYRPIARSARALRLNGQGRLA